MRAYIAARCDRRRVRRARRGGAASTTRGQAEPAPRSHACTPRVGTGRRGDRFDDVFPRLARLFSAARENFHRDPSARRRGAGKSNSDSVRSVLTTTSGVRQDHTACVVMTNNTTV